MATLIYIDIFLLGLIFGSFLNTVIYRLRKGEGFVMGRSTCPHCDHQLAWDDLIPVFSFIILGGKCRYCGHKISWQYPAVELITGILFLGAFHQNVDLFFDFLSFGVLKIIFLFYVISSLVVIFVYDLKHYLIPNKVVYPLIGITALWIPVSAFFFQIYSLAEVLSFFVVAFEVMAFFWIIHVMTGGNGMGMGDVKFGFFMGLLLGGDQVIIALFLSFLIGAIVGLVLIMIGEKGFKSEVPFAPFLVSGTFLVMFFSDFFLNLDLFWFLD
jgi:leader peptidase (prepilin peptidase)/N-methyltransferase